MLLMEAIEKVAAQAFMPGGKRKPRPQAEAYILGRIQARKGKHTSSQPFPLSGRVVQAAVGASRSKSQRN
jgi:hypothetical protein